MRAGVWAARRRPAGWGGRLTLPAMNLASLDMDRGALLILDINSLFSTTLLKLLSVRLARKRYSCGRCGR